MRDIWSFSPSCYDNRFIIISFIWHTFLVACLRSWMGFHTFLVVFMSTFEDKDPSHINQIFIQTACWGSMCTSIYSHRTLILIELKPFRTLDQSRLLLLLKLSAIATSFAFKITATFVIFCCHLGMCSPCDVTTHLLCTTHFFGNFRKINK